MAPEPARRPKRNPLTAEEVAEIIALKKKRDHLRLMRFKKSRAYKLMNIFSIACFFIYVELLFCFFGPAAYERHKSIDIKPLYGNEVNERGDFSIYALQIYTQRGRQFDFIVNDFMQVPADNPEINIGKDFLLRKELKGSFDGSETAYRVFAASPVLLLSFLAMFLSLAAYLLNLNENTYSLTALTVLNSLSMLGIISF